jgi:site-specific DNA recombinase
MHQKADQGYWPTHAPVGYQNIVGENGKRTIIPDPERAPLVKKLFEIYAEGVFSCRELAKMARNMGLTFRKSKKPITTAGIHYMLKSLIYTGSFEFGGKFYPGNYEALITRDLWDAVQTVRAGKNQNKLKNSKNEFAYAHTLRCGYCGCSIIGEIKNSYLIYYHCTGYKGRCPDPYTREEVLEARFLEEFEKITVDQDIAELIVEALEQSQSESEKFKSGSVTRLKEQLISFKTQRDALLDLKLNNRIDDSVFDCKNKKFTESINLLETNVKTLESSKKTGIESLKTLLKHLPTIKTTFKNLGSMDKRKLVNLVFIGSTWKAGILNTKPQSPFDEIALYKQQNPFSKRENSEVLVKTNKWLGD